ncbi:MAG TPA: pyrrolo-quinoline quinone, partial [Planctomycetaceae bacterium]|nr:pyrrolo-quinoline quinone [Planctomycetaceae bacterium]
MSNRCVLSLLLLCGLVVMPTPVSAENWASWRGPRGNGTSTEKGLAVSWDSKRNVAWRVALPGASGATPVVWDDRIFVSTADGDDLSLVCISIDGKELWRRRVGTGNRQVGFGDAEGNMASPSPVTDGRHVWVLMGTGDLACFDRYGKLVWKTNIQEKYGRFDIQFGMSSTPLLADGRLYIQVIHGPMRGAEEPAYVVALDQKTGRQVWKKDRKTGAQMECKHSY